MAWRLSMQTPQYDHIIPAASFAGTGVQIAPVRPNLRRWVQCLWVAFETNRNETFHHEKLYPDAGSSLTFEISPRGAQAAFFYHASVCTQRWDLHKRFISVRLRAGAGAALFGIRVESTGNQKLSIPMTSALARLLSQLPEASAAVQLRLIEGWLEGLCKLAGNALDKWSKLLTIAFTSLTPPQQLAAQQGLSRRTLERQLRNRFGFSPNQLYGFAQIRHARTQLITTQAELSDIALRCGFYDQAHFTNSFHERALETPGQYRTRKLSQISN